MCINNKGKSQVPHRTIKNTQRQWVTCLRLFVKSVAGITCFSSQHMVLPINVFCKETKQEVDPCSSPLVKSSSRSVMRQSWGCREPGHWQCVPSSHCSYCYFWSGVWKEISLSCSLWVWASCSQVPIWGGGFCWGAADLLLSVCSWKCSLQFQKSAGVCCGVGHVGAQACWRFQLWFCMKQTWRPHPVCAGQAGGHELSVLCHCSWIGPL